MKTRLGFVSNSSSTSYLVALKKSDRCPTCHRSDFNFFDLVERIGTRADSEDTELIARGLANITREIDCIWLSADENREWIDRLGRVKQAEEIGYEVGYVEISYHDLFSSEILQSLRDRGLVTVLWDDHKGDHTVNL